MLSLATHTCVTLTPWSKCWIVLRGYVYLDRLLSIPTEWWMKEQDSSYMFDIMPTCDIWNQIYYSDVIMSAMASQTTGVSMVYSTLCSGADQRKHQSSSSLAFVMGNSPATGEFPSQRASNAENISIWWRHHASMAKALTWSSLNIPA